MFLAMVEFGIWHIVHSLDSYMPVFLKWAARPPTLESKICYRFLSRFAMSLTSAAFLKLYVPPGWC